MPERKIELLDSRFKVHSVSGYNPMIIEAEYIGPVACPRCEGTRLRTKDRIQRRLRHESMGRRKTWIHLVLRKYQCLDCDRYFRARMPGILPYKAQYRAVPHAGVPEPSRRHFTGAIAAQLQDRHGHGRTLVPRPSGASGTHVHRAKVPGRARHQYRFIIVDKFNP